ncbi:MAG: hypothetical protein PHQ17_03130 [Methanobacterium sp.]|nr:hypothetical protein [Methanobacterium sp.]
MDNCVADSSFYICWADDMGKEICLREFLSFYKFHVGETILNEISRGYLSDHEFRSELKVSSFDYTVLFAPLIKGRLDKGEFEAIGIAKNLFDQGKLKHLILDDGPARNLLKREFPLLENNQCGTVGFVRECYYNGNISEEKAIKTLEAIKKKIINNTDEKKRICSMGIGDYADIIHPTIKRIRRGF